MTFAASRSCGLQALALYRKQTTFIEKGTIRMSDANSSRRTFMALAAAAPAALAMGSRASAQAATVGPAALPGAGRAAVVTGSSRGIGAATARRLASDGFAVTLNYLTNRNLAARVVADIEAAGDAPSFARPTSPILRRSRLFSTPTTRRSGALTWWSTTPAS